MRAAHATVVGLLVIEALALAGVLVWFVVELVTATPDSVAAAVAMLVMVALATVWLATTAVAAWRRQAWSRPSAIVWQVLQLSVAVGAFQGLFARADVGWALLVPAIVVIGLLLWPPLRERFARDAPAGDTPAG